MFRFVGIKSRTKEQLQRLMYHEEMEIWMENAKLEDMRLKVRSLLVMLLYRVFGATSILHSTEVAFLLLTQQPQVRFSAFPRIFLLMLLRFIDGTA